MAQLGELMQRFSCQLLFFVLFTSVCGTADFICAESKPNQLTDAERRAGWKLLFDGETTAGWRNYRQDDIDGGWVVQDGTLTRLKKGAGDIISSGRYGTFELSLEYRIARGGNSGVMFHVTEKYDRPWQSGPEVQILDNEIGGDGQKSGWLYDLYGPVKPSWLFEIEKVAGRNSPMVVDATRPAGQWNQIHLRVGEQCEVLMNGVSYLFFRLGDEEWEKRVAASKFANYPDFGKASNGHLCLQDHGNVVSYRNIKIRALGKGDSVPEPIDGRLPVAAKIAFPELIWEDWEPVDERGRAKPLRLIDLTYAEDKTNRLFAAAQSGMIYVFLNDPAVRESKLFIDLRSKIVDWNGPGFNNELGLLGLAMHPDYVNNGMFYVHYSPRKGSTASCISRFRVSKSDANRADPDSEEILLHIPQPYPNHNGGSIEFGPDGYLYIAMGDGGSRNDPLAFGQDLSSLMGKILRIDVDRKTEGRNYAIPGDNPFRQVTNARPEIFAYGFRNVWRLAFDRQSGTLWAADVGQDLWEEVNVIHKGGNYGWSLREGRHLFGNSRRKPQGPPIDPVWEYDHRVGLSVTGGRVYRSQRLPELTGRYLYGDFVARKVWGLEYDQATKQVKNNSLVAQIDEPILAFGEDQQGEVYCLVDSALGRSIYRFENTNE